MEGGNKHIQLFFQKGVGTTLPTFVVFTALMLNILFQKAEESKDRTKHKVLTLACTATCIK